MGQKTNQQMVEQSNNITRGCVILFLSMHSIFAYAQSSICGDIKIVRSINIKKFHKEDSIQFEFKNDGAEKLQYTLEVWAFSNKDWFYSDYYTRYFNKEITYLKLKKFLNNKLPYVSPKNYSIPVYDLLPKQISSLRFIANSKENIERLIKFRLHIYHGIENCELDLSTPFYFIGIK